jgi:hypothetical protein
MMTKTKWLTTSVAVLAGLASLTITTNAGAEGDLTLNYDQHTIATELSYVL